MTHIYRGHGDPLEDNRVQVWFVKSQNDGSWGYETATKGGYGCDSLEEAMKYYLAVRDSEDAI